MIHRLKEQDKEAVISIWLDASVIAHDFIAKDYWNEKTTDMRNIYLPKSDTFVYKNNKQEITGFISIVNNYIAALFVSPAAQGQGIGQALMAFAKQNHEVLFLGVYSKNVKSVQFYLKQGFTITGEKTEPHTGELETEMIFKAIK